MASTVRLHCPVPAFQHFHLFVYYFCFYSSVYFEERVPFCFCMFWKVYIAMS